MCILLYYWANEMMMTLIVPIQQPAALTMMAA